MRISFLAVPAVAVLLAGCRPATPEKLLYDMGERATVGTLTYVVVEGGWRTQLGESFNVRMPQQRFMVLTVSVTNGGGAETSIPLLELESPKGQRYKEVADGAGVPNWLGLLRTIAPAQTVQGNILFDVPLSSFKLLVPEGGESETTKYAQIEIPLRIDSDQVQSEMPTSIELK